MIAVFIRHFHLPAYSLLYRLSSPTRPKSMITPLLIITIENCIVIDPYCIGLRVSVEAGGRMSYQRLMEVMVSFPILRESPLLILASIHLFASKDSSSLPILHLIPANTLINQAYFFLLTMSPFSLLIFSSNFSTLRFLSHILIILNLVFLHIFFKVAQISFLVEK